MRMLIDMNLSPDWVSLLRSHGHHAEHWADVGRADATDRAIMDWAKSHGFVVLTHDLDFSAILAASGGSGPSVLQVRARDTTTAGMGSIVLNALSQFDRELTRGAIVVVEPARAKARILPLS